MRLCSVPRICVQIAEKLDIIWLGEFVSIVCECARERVEQLSQNELSMLSHDNINSIMRNASISFH